MAKAVKKKGKNRRLKRSIRKTLGAMFLASALAVAAIPTEGLQAAGDPNNNGASIEVDVFQQGKIPKVDENATIYTYPMEGTGITFRFAYVSPESGQEGSDTSVAVILGYTQIGNLEGGTLNVPETVEAYKKYSLSTTDAGSAAVNMSGQFLYYMRKELVYDSNNQPVYVKGDAALGDRVDPTTGYKLGADGKPIQETKDVYKPCYYADRAEWKDDAILYEADATSPSGYKETTTERIAKAIVAYIGSQYLVEEDTGVWKIAGEVTKPEDGVFYNQTNITNLVLGKDIMGVGNYAFANTGIRSVTFGNGLRCLGNYAFANSTNLSEVKFDLSCGVDVIGSHCFNNCTALQSIDLPSNVQKIGDCAFDGCQNLSTINMVYRDSTSGTGYLYTGSLNALGQSVFRNCSKLESLEFPNQFGSAVDVSEFEGCSSLFYIKTDGNSNFSLKEGDLSSFGFSEFKDTVLKAFYLEGPKNAALHKVATAQRIAYKFHDPDLNMDVYELVVGEVGVEGVLYWVNEEGKIVKCEMENGGRMETVTLPEVVGPKNIVGIDSGTFQNKCFLKTITIPASVTYIADNAFRGSHRLENVIFTEAKNIQTIGQGAFSTQDATGHLTGCNGVEGHESHLNFVGTISSDCKPFTYAMTPSEYINTGSQYRTYITYLSGWPTNLAVRYNEVTDSNELIDYPTFSELASGTKYTEGNYAYMTAELSAAATAAALKYSNNPSSMTDYEKEIVNATLNLKLPDGIESIASVDPETGELKDSPTEGTEGTDDYKINQGLFSYKEGQNDNVLLNGKKTLTAEGLRKIEVEAFKDCDTLAGVTFIGPLDSIGSYAFEGCDYLTSVSVPESISELGLRPFTDCEKLDNVNFNGSVNFGCDNSIIFELDGSGNKAKVVEFLCGRRAPSVKPDVLEGVVEIYPEAFMSTDVLSVDLSQSKITTVPVNAFRETAALTSVILPNTCSTIQENAFTDSNIIELTLPKSVVYINPNAFNDVEGDEYSGMTNVEKLTFYCADDSAAADIADAWTPKIYHEPAKEIITYKVTFMGWDETAERPNDPKTMIELGTIDALENYPVEDYEVPVNPAEFEGYHFVGWSPDLEDTIITKDMQFNAVYEKNDPTKVTVTFRNDDGTYITAKTIDKGEAVEFPRDPTSALSAGSVFTGWQRSDTGEIVAKDKGRIDNLENDLTLFACYNGNGTTSGNGSGGNGSSGDGTGGNGSSGDGTGGNGTGGNGTTSGNGSGTGTGTYYTLTVINGHGSGSYVAGTQAIISANDPASGMEFSNWTIDPSGTTIASTGVSATVVTMPAANVTVTAHYRAKTGSSTGSGNSSSANSGRRPNNTGTVSSGGTTVVIDKNGISNTGVVAATVNGSSDNFVIKITESSEASEAVVRALMAEYGSLDNIKYFPMDISLYDSTGTNKITDTTGLSVSITLPIPDSLITYAGNNRVAGVVNDRLDKLTPKFTTISGVSCITFTAEHFSPYVIYVDTANLSAGGSADSTPKTGDGIHPKWFLSVGLACLSFVMFMQKDKRKPQKVKVKAKAKA